MKKIAFSMLAISVLSLIVNLVCSWNLIVIITENYGMPLSVPGTGKWWASYFLSAIICYWTGRIFFECAEFTDIKFFKKLT